MTDCTCTVVAPVHHGCVLLGIYNKYAIYLDYIEDNSVTDPACPYHGTNGTMVMTLYATSHSRIKKESNEDTCV